MKYEDESMSYSPGKSPNRRISRKGLPSVSNLNRRATGSGFGLNVASALEEGNQEQILMSRSGEGLPAKLLNSSIKSKTILEEDEIKPVPEVL